jgi:hypothetical protein
VAAIEAPQALDEQEAHTEAVIPALRPIRHPAAGRPPVGSGL